MRVSSFILVLSIVGFAGARAARADLRESLTLRPAEAAVPAEAALPTTASLYAFLVAPEQAAGAYARPEVTDPHAGREPALATLDVPPPPSSLSLVLSAFGALGAWQAARSARKLNLSHVPDWYADHATPIGRAVPFDLHLQSPLLCTFAHPLQPCGLFPHPAPDDAATPPDRVASQASPRAPPKTHG